MNNGEVTHMLFSLTKERLWIFLVLVRLEECVLPLQNHIHTEMGRQVINERGC